ncbi:MAG: hypothetical protein ACI87T_002121, partial [Planctomycetota bacterium]
ARHAAISPTGTSIAVFAAADLLRQKKWARAFIAANGPTGRHERGPELPETPLYATVVLWRQAIWGMPLE